MTTVAMVANTLLYPQGGGHHWVYLNWALGLRAIGCDVIWFEPAYPAEVDVLHQYVAAIKQRLAPFGLDESVALCSLTPEPFDVADRLDCLGEDHLDRAELLLNFRYNLPRRFVQRAARSALVDIDPGLLQVWINEEVLNVAPHDVYFTTGETVVRPGSAIPDVGLKWLYTPPCVALDYWPVTPAAADAPFTTVSHWRADEWVVDRDVTYRNSKRVGFLPYRSLPRRTTIPLELALCLDEDDADGEHLRSRGWRVRDANDVASTPCEYQRYLQSSRGEFACAKPSCLRLENAWISDRTLCYLASGKPAVVQYTGASRFLPDDAGLFRFRTIGEAVRGLERAAGDYERHSAHARALAEQYFDARTVVRDVLTRAL